MRWVVHHLLYSIEKNYPLPFIRDTPCAIAGGNLSRKKIKILSNLIRLLQKADAERMDGTSGRCRHACAISGDTTPFDRHPNHLAHGIIADTVSKYLLANGIMESPAD